MSMAMAGALGNASATQGPGMLDKLKGLFSFGGHPLVGKWKVSQNQPRQNQQSVAQGLLSEGADAQTQMASLVQAHGGL